MRKKLTAILPLYLAGMIMLAFAVFPHHHHDRFICFNTTVCHSAENSEHHTHGNSSGESCVKHLFQIKMNRNLSLHDSCHEGHCQHFVLPFLLSAEIFRLLSLNHTEEGKSVPVYRETLHPVDYISPSTGRAPPTIA